MNEKAIQVLKEALEKEETELTNDLKSIAQPDKKSWGGWKTKFPSFSLREFFSSTSREEEADEVEEFETRLATEQSLESRLLEVKRALERIKNGTYGFCAKCKKEISAERLQANPAAEFDLDHN